MLISTTNTNLISNASISVIAGNADDVTRAIDGDINTWVDLGHNRGTVKIDFGTTIEPSSVSMIKFWQYFADGRSYNNVKLEISVDAFNWLPIYGPYTASFTSLGKTLSLTPLGMYFYKFIINNVIIITII